MKNNGNSNKLCYFSEKESLHKKTWEVGKKIDKISLTNTGSFYSNLVIKDVSEPYYEHAENVWNIFEMKNLEDYHDFNVQSDTLFLADIFENKN